MIVCDIKDLYDALSKVVKSYYDIVGSTGMALCIVALVFTLILCFCIGYEIFKKPEKETVIRFMIKDSTEANESNDHLDNGFDYPDSYYSCSSEAYEYNISQAIGKDDFEATITSQPTSKEKEDDV